MNIWDIIRLFFVYFWAITNMNLKTYFWAIWYGSWIVWHIVQICITLKYSSSMISHNNTWYHQVAISYTEKREVCQWKSNFLFDHQFNLPLPREHFLALYIFQCWYQTQLLDHLLDSLVDNHTFCLFWRNDHQSIIRCSYSNQWHNHWSFQILMTKNKTITLILKYH